MKSFKMKEYTNDYKELQFWVRLQSRLQSRVLMIGTNNLRHWISWYIVSIEIHHHTSNSNRWKKLDRQQFGLETSDMTWKVKSNK